MKLFGSSFILALAAASPTVKRTCSPSIVEAPIIGGNTYPGYVQPSVNRPAIVGGNPATWGPGNQPRPQRDIVGGDRRTWGPVQ